MRDLKISTEGWILAVDPGIRGSGVALFSPEGTLTRAAYVKNPAKKGNGPLECVEMATKIAAWCTPDYPEILVFETPQVYTQGHLKGDPNDLLPLVGVNAALTQFLACSHALKPGRRPEIFSYLPKQWKGQLTKEVCNARVRSRLTPEEISRIEDAGSKTHNVLDAVGIGLFHLGRFSPARVIAR